MIEMLLSGGGGGGVPAGTIIGFSGTLAQARALNDWAICDGTNNTPDLNGRMIIGASGDYPFGSEGQGGRVGGGRGSTAGVHHNPTTTVSAMGPNPGASSGPSGDHSHSLLSNTVPNPAARQTLFIQAIRETLIPQYGVVWMESAPRQGVVVDTTIFSRFLVGVTDSSRGNVGNDSITLNLSVSTGGGHTHTTGSEDYVSPSNASGGISKHFSGGSHTHTVASKSITAVPPWYGLSPGRVVEDLAPWKGLVLAYNGDLATLSRPWREFTQLKGRIPRGAATPGRTGGTARQIVTATIGTNTFTHDHSLRNYYASFSRDLPHRDFSLAHTHDSMSLTYSNLPPYKALHYITI